ncbi:MAG: DUF3006 domain-containing protein [Ruminococcaceae bacterium]|nr:DUF3006 domain-containing protein [Oscillospiraceae bacterium]
MYYSVIQVKGQFVVTQDPYGEIQVYSIEFFDYEVKENDVVYLKDGMLRYAKEETERRQTENYDRMQDLFGN